MRIEAAIDKTPMKPLVPQEFIDLLQWAEKAYFEIPRKRRFNFFVLERAKAYINEHLQEQFRKNLAESEADMKEKLKPYEDGEAATKRLMGNYETE